MDNELVLVEFVGAAGVGKSMLCANVLKVLKQRNFVATDYRSIAFRKRGLRTALIAMHSAVLVASIKPNSFRAFIGITRHIARHRLRWDVCRRNPAIYLCDEGLIHRLRAFSRACSGLSMISIAERLARHVVVGNIVVVVEASTVKIRSNRMKRQKPQDQFDLESIAADVRLLEESIATITHLQESSNPGMRIIRVDAEVEDISEIVAQIADAAQDALGNRSNA